MRSTAPSASVLSMLCVIAAGLDASPSMSAASWQEAMAGLRDAREPPAVPAGERAAHLVESSRRIEKAFPVEWDWFLQDAGLDVSRWVDAADPAAADAALIARVLDELGAAEADLAAEFETVRRDGGAAATDRRRLDLYARACERRRAARLASLLGRYPKIVFTKHLDLGGSHYAYTEGQSDAQDERQFEPGAALCLLDMTGLRGTVTTLIDDRRGIIRDPDVSYDGTRILFAWKKSDRGDDYHLHEMDVATREVRQLTFGLGFADYEGAYLPDGHIVFNSTRCVQTVDCWWTEVSNLYTCDGDGRFLRRLSFDQVHTNFPTVLDDGRVIYTRWEYVDRGQIYPQPLFQMAPDGTAQTEYYGNNSYFPTSILHARGIPGTHKVVAVLSGHHSRQTGTLALIDVAQGNQEASGIQELAPVRPARAVRVDAYGQGGPLFQYPYPLSESEFLVTYAPYGWAKKPPRFAIYWMASDGRRELLAADPDTSSNQPIPLAPRPVPHPRPSVVDYAKDHGIFYVHDVHAGAGLEGVPRGTIKRIRVVALRHRPAGVRSNRNGGPAGGALICTPIAIGNGAWNVKVVLGDADVREDGSACFTVPARTPVYFQALDAKGRMVQTMRSWSTLQPGEHLACVGCHEPKREVPAAVTRTTLALKAGPQALTPFYGEPRGFSFAREIQPILDRHCTRCHFDRTKAAPGAETAAAMARLLGAADGAGHAAARSSADPGGAGGEIAPAFSLLGICSAEQASGRRWADSYLALTNAFSQEGFLYGRPNRIVSWISAQSEPTMLPPYHAGATRSELFAILERGHYNVALDREEFEKLACWIDLLVPCCGDYEEANAWTEGELAKYRHFLEKRTRMEALERDNVASFIADRRKDSR